MCTLTAAFFTRNDSRVSEMRTRQYAAHVLFAQRLVTWPVTLRQSGSIWDRVIERADVFILREATRQSGVSISAALDGSGSTLFAPGRSALDLACAQKWHINSFALPLNVRILHFGALHWEGAYL